MFTVALLILIGIQASAEHVCMHDDPEFRAKYIPEFNLRDYSGIRSPQRGDENDPLHRSFKGQAGRQPIRIVVSADDVYSTSCYAGVTSVPDYSGGTIACTPETLMTVAKRDALLNQVLPSAIALLSNALAVTPLTGNLVVTSPCSSPFTTPSNHTTTGVPNADFVLYVASVPTSGSTVAWAGFCSVNDNNRPITGRMNINPAYINFNLNDPVGTRTLVRTIAHEMMHALGFSSGFWNYGGFPSVPTRTETRRGKTATYITSANAKAQARTHFNCSTLNGPEIEDQGGSGTAGSHWKRRGHYDDMMAGIVGDYMYLSGVTLGLMEDSGHYSANWTAAESPEWMRHSGCGSQFDKCNVACGGLGTAFCNIKASTTKDTCDYTYRGYGLCGITSYNGDLPSYAQYDPSNPRIGGKASLMDYCPIVQTYSNRECDNPANTYGNDTLYAEYFATDGRCFETSANVTVKQSGASGSRVAGEPRCLQTRCVVNGSSYAVEFKIVPSQPWASCGETGSKVNLTAFGYDGEIICPDPRSMCLTAKLFVSLPATFESKEPSFCDAPTRDSTPGGTGSGVLAMSAVLPVCISILSLILFWLF